MVNFAGQILWLQAGKRNTRLHSSSEDSHFCHFKALATSELASMPEDLKSPYTKTKFGKVLSELVARILLGIFRC